MVEQSPATSAERQTGQERSSETTSPPQRERRFTRGRRPGGFRGRRGRPRRPRQCAFCVSKVSDVDYKQVDLLRPYITNRGKIRPRRQTGLCAKHQRRVARAIKRARHLALIPYTTGGHGRFPD